jgi:hypothetical protein
MVLPVMRRTKRLLGCAVVGLATVAVGACSNSDASIPPAQAVEKSAAIDSGDSVCQALAADQATLLAQFKSAHPNPSDSDTRDYLVNTWSPRLERAVGDFHRIGEPTKDKNGWDLIVADLDNDLADFKSSISTDPAKLLDAKPFNDEAKAFNDYGFKDCAKSLS